MPLAFSRTKLVCEACKDKDASSKARPDRDFKILCDICYEDTQEVRPVTCAYDVGDVWLCSMGYRWIITGVITDVVKSRKQGRTTHVAWDLSGKRVNFPHHSLVKLVTCERWIPFKHMAPPPSCAGDGRALITTPGAHRGASGLLQPMSGGKWSCSLHGHVYTDQNISNDLGHAYWKLIELPDV